MTLELYQDKPIIPQQRFQVDTGSAMQIANATDRLVQRLQGVEAATVSLIEPAIREETVKTALADVEQGKINSDNVAMVARDIYRNTANKAFIADMEVSGANLAKSIEARQIQAGRYDAQAFNQSWNTFMRNSLGQIKDLEIKNNVENKLAKLGAQYGGAISTLQAKQQRGIQVDNFEAKITMDTEALNNSFGVFDAEAENSMVEIDQTLQTMVNAGMLSPGAAMLKRKQIIKNAVMFNLQRKLTQSVNDGTVYKFYDEFKGVDTKQYEGFSNVVYKDTEGHDTIGYGHKLTNAEKKSGKYKDGISKAEAERLYKQDKQVHVDALYKEYPELINQPQQVRAALEDMAFNMGVGSRGNKKGLSSFVNMLQHINNGNYVAAGKLIRGSKYARQVGQRAIDNAMRIESGILNPTEIEAFRKNIQSQIATDVAVYEKQQQQQETEFKVREKEQVDLFNDQLISGTLSINDVDQALANGDIELSTHDTYVKKMQVKDKGYDNPDKLLTFQVHVLDFTEEEILDSPHLTNKTKWDLIQQRRSEIDNETNWLSSQNGKEARDRIKRTFNIIDGTLMAQMDFNNQNMVDYDTLYKEFYSEVEALPIEQRAVKSIGVADRLITKYKADKDDERTKKREAREVKKKEKEEKAKQAYNDSITGRFMNMLDNKHQTSAKVWEDY